MTFFSAPIIIAFYTLVGMGLRSGWRGSCFLGLLLSSPAGPVWCGTVGIGGKGHRNPEGVGISMSWTILGRLLKGGGISSEPSRAWVIRFRAVGEGKEGWMETPEGVMEGVWGLGAGVGRQGDGLGGGIWSRSVLWKETHGEQVMLWWESVLNTSPAAVCRMKRDASTEDGRSNFQFPSHLGMRRRVWAGA